MGSPSAGEAVHAHMMKVGILHEITSSNHLLNMYARCGRTDDARKVFVEMPERNIVSWSAMIAGHARCGEPCSALNWGKEMHVAGVTPTQFALASLAQACSDLRDVARGKQIHAQAIISGFYLDNFVKTALVNVYSKCKDIGSTLSIFESFEIRDLVLYNAMIAGFLSCALKVEALHLFKEVKFLNLEPNESTFVSVIGACSTEVGIRVGEQIHACTVRCGLDTNDYVGTALVDMYSRYADMESAVMVFNGVIFKDAALWNAMIVIKLGCVGDLVVQNALLNALVKGMEIDEAHMVFKGILEKNLVSWTTMITGFSQLGLDMEALGLFQSMQIAGLHPNNFTCASILRACASISALEQGQSIHGYMIKHGIEEEDFIYNALVDMYAKSKEALELLEKMHQSGTKLNNVTFICILSACSHSGLIDQGVNIFESMASKFGVLPSMDHYACMVDMFGRAGMLDRAKDLIDGMQFEANAFIWKTFLSCCKLHGHLEFAQHAREHILRLEPEDSSMFVAMSNLYSGVGEWQNVQKLRNKMKERRMKKEPGMSWLETKHGG
ncbi:Pentatricopeptide repeat-containing protein [Nymphaea thermarum]|nr:Pentatricopeptide repeat-containing protein [Nymphaea thermarum]